jgi:GNAT superfamily N-acetyltransferase
MIDLEIDCELISLTEDSPISSFDCGSADMNDFFCHDAILYQRQLLGQTYYFRLKTTGEIVTAYTISNDSIKVSDLPGSRKKKVKEDIPSEKQMRSYPATLIGRLGVLSKFMGQGVGTQVLDFIKATCIIEDANRCRFLLVDSYNNPQALSLYTKNDFKFLFSTKEQEKEYYKKSPDEPLKTRFMFFDLLPWANEAGK